MINCKNVPGGTKNASSSAAPTVMGRIGGKSGPGEDHLSHDRPWNDRRSEDFLFAAQKQALVRIFPSFFKY